LGIVAGVCQQISPIEQIDAWSFTSTASLETEMWGVEGHVAYLRDWWKSAGRNLENGYIRGTCRWIVYQWAGSLILL
jgi:hypothetical protein